MHRFFRVASICLPVVLVSGDIAAQVCAGRPSFSSMQVGAVAQFGNDATVLGADLSVGKDRGLFGRAGVAREILDANGLGKNPAGWVFAGALGYQIGGGRLQICPLVSGDWGKIKMSENAKLKRSEFRLGAMFGLSPASGGRLVPFAGVAFAQLSRDLEGEADQEVSFGTDTYFPITLGLGWHQSAFALVGDVTIPANLGGADPWFTIRAVIPFGMR